MRLDEVIFAIFAEYDVQIAYSRGDEVKFKCPFHESTGRQRHNASINTDTGAWTCYNGSCGACGNNFASMYARLVGKPLPEAIAELKKDYDYSHEDDVFADKKRYQTFKYEIFKLPKTFRDISWKHPHIVENNFRYDIIQKYRVGIDVEKNDDGKFLRGNEIVIPWFFEGNCVGWSIKYLDGKYKYNFEKKYFLYGYDDAWKDKPIVICEGQRDVWRLAGFGENVIGLGGSKASKEQINLIISNWNTVVLCLDGDEAGDGGNKQMYKNFKDVVNTYIIELPRGKDPCDITTLEEWRTHREVEADEYYGNKSSFYLT